MHARTLAGAIAFSIVGALTTSPASATLIGDSVHAQYLFPTVTDLLFDGGTKTIAAGTTFNLGNFTASFSDTQITVTNLGAGRYSDVGPFNGLDLAFLSGPAITSVTEDPLSTSIFATGSVVTFTANDIKVNFAGTCDECTGGEKIILNVTTAETAVPEPATVALFASGLLGLGLMKRRHNST